MKILSAASLIKSINNSPDTRKKWRISILATLNISFEEEELKFINTSDLFFNRDCPFTYFLKESLPCEVTYLENGKQLTLSGVLKLARVDGEIKFDPIVVETDCNSHELGIQGILSITKQCKG